MDDARGTSAVEYGLWIAAVFLAVATIVFALGSVVSRAFDRGCQAVAHSQVDRCPTGGAP